MTTFTVKRADLIRAGSAALAATAVLVVGGCAVSVGSGGVGAGGSGASIPGGGGMPGGGSSGGGMPGGGSSGGGMPGGGSSGGGMPGGGSSGGGMPGGGSSGGGMPGGGSSGGAAGGGSSGGAAGGGASGGAAGGGAGGGVRGIGGQLPGGGPGGNASGTGEAGDCGNDLPGGVGGMEQPGNCEGGAGDVGQVPGESKAERQERLEGELEKSVGGFDEVLAEEQDEISTVSRDTEGYGGGGGGGTVGLGKQGNVKGSGEVAETPSQQGNEPSPLAGMSEEEIDERTPDDIPTLVSEDIVAKQLREAALAEDDPELRERLWDEYRRYNQL